MNKSLSELKTKLDYHYNAFDKSKISPDPLQFLHLFKDENNIESIGFIASVMAYGNVIQIINSLNKILDITGSNPYRFIINYPDAGNKSYFKNIKHRFYSSDDIHLLFLVLHNVYKKCGSLKNLFIDSYDKDEFNIKDLLNRFSINLLSIAEKENPNSRLSPGLKFMFPLPQKGSACKRMNLFLRWMVRKDELDFGIWQNEISKDKLIIPVDTHVAKVCKSLKLTKRKIADWKMAEEITSNLRKIDHEDPIKYDFAICHIGMRKIKF